MYDWFLKALTIYKKMSLPNDKCGDGLFNYVEPKLNL